MNDTKVFGKAWGLLMLLLVVAEASFVGSDLTAKHWQSAIVNGILLAFWLFGAIWFHIMAIKETKEDLAFQATHRKLDQAISDLKDKIEAITTGDDDEHEAELQKELKSIIKGVVTKEQVETMSPLTKAQLAVVKTKFKQNTGHGLEFRLNKEGKQEFSITCPDDKDAE